MGSDYGAEEEILSEEQERDLACADLFRGRAPQAAGRFLSLVNTGAFDPINHYWLAAAYGAMGDWSAHHAALKKAQAFHALKVIKASDGDLAKLQSDPEYAALVGGAFYNAGHVAVSALGFGRACMADEPDLLSLISYGLALMHQGQAEEAVSAFTMACELFPESARAHSCLLYSLFYVENGVERHGDQARRWRRMQSGLRPMPRSAFQNASSHGRRLRIGYVAPRLDGQCRQFVCPVLDHHDETRVSVTLYLQHFDATENLRADNIRLVGDMSDDALVDAIRQDEIDVLIDLWGHTIDGRLGVFARRAAPVQVSWLNYVQTTGVPEMDYLIHADSMKTPEAASQCVEEIWHIGPIISPFRPDERPALAPTPALANGYVTFGSYNHPARLNDQTLDAWAKILQQTPNSRLVLRYKYFADEVLQNTLLMRFAARGVRPEAIDFRKAQPQPAYYQSYAEIDIALDPSPTPGGTTSCDAIANGVPLLTLAGEDYFSRIGLAVVEPLGLHELVAQDWDDYVARAAALAADVPRLDALRMRVRAAFDASGRRDEAGFTKTLEAAFFEMFERWRAQRVTRAA